MDVFLLMFDVAQAQFDGKWDFYVVFAAWNIEEVEENLWLFFFAFSKRRSFWGWIFFLIEFSASWGLRMFWLQSFVKVVSALINQNQVADDVKKLHGIEF